MTTYSSFEEAKIANPGSEIIRWNKSDEYKAVSKSELSGYLTTWCHCNPADHCMTVEQFLKDGHEFVEGDLIINVNGAVNEVRNDEGEIFSKQGVSELNGERYILRAAALEKQTESVVKDSPKRKKVEYVKVDF